MGKFYSTKGDCLMLDGVNHKKPGVALGLNRVGGTAERNYKDGTPCGVWVRAFGWYAHAVLPRWWKRDKSAPQYVRVKYPYVGNIRWAFMRWADSEWQYVVLHDWHQEAQSIQSPHHAHHPGT